MNSRSKSGLPDHLKVQFVNFFLAGRLLARSRYFLFFPGTLLPPPLPSSPAGLQITVFSSRPVNDLPRRATLEFCLINVYPPSCFPVEENQISLSSSLSSPPFSLSFYRFALSSSSTSFPGPSFFRSFSFPTRWETRSSGKKWSVDD